MGVVAVSMIFILLWDQFPTSLSLSQLPLDRGSKYYQLPPKLSLSLAVKVLLAPAKSLAKVTNFIEQINNYDHPFCKPEFAID